MLSSWISCCSSERPFSSMISVSSIDRQTRSARSAFVRPDAHTSVDVLGIYSIYLVVTRNLLVRVFSPFAAGSIRTRCLSSHPHLTFSVSVSLSQAIVSASSRLQTTPSQINFTSRLISDPAHQPPQAGLSCSIRTSSTPSRPRPRS